MLRVIHKVNCANLDFPAYYDVSVYICRPTTDHVSNLVVCTCAYIYSVTIELKQHRSLYFTET